MNKNHKVLELSILAGRILLENGGEIYRVQETMERILRSFGVEDYNVYVISNGIFATVGETGDNPCHAVRNVPLVGDVHLGRITAVNELSREIAAAGGTGDIDAYCERMRRCETIADAPKWLRFAACAVAAASFCYILGGTVRDSLAALVVGIALQGLLFLCERVRLHKFIVRILGGAWVTLVCQCLITWGLGDSLDSMIIGSIIALVPGVALTTAIRDFFNSDHLSGTVHLVDALLIAASIAVGVGAMLSLWSFVQGVSL